MDPCFLAGFKSLGSIAIGYNAVMAHTIELAKGDLHVFELPAGIESTGKFRSYRWRWRIDFYWGSSNQSQSVVSQTPYDSRESATRRAKEQAERLHISLAGTQFESLPKYWPWVS